METAKNTEAWQRIAGSTQTLVRSRIEIAKILQEIVDGGLPLLSHLQVHDRLFITRLHEVCAEQNFISVAYSDNRNANADVFTAGSVAFGACHRKGHVGFVAGKPVVQSEPVPMLRFDFPDFVLIEQRRSDHRIRDADKIDRLVKVFVLDLERHEETD